MKIRPFAPGDEHGIREIYNHYISNTVVTFEEEPLSTQQMRERIESYLQHNPWFVCEDKQGQVLGYSYASAFHQRAAYRHTVEVTVYVHKDHARKGIGKALYEPLLAHLAAHGCHAALAAIALPNESSVGLHEDCGFTPVGRFSEVGRKFGQWIDIGYWQKLFTPSGQTTGEHR